MSTTEYERSENERMQSEAIERAREQLREEVKAARAALRRADRSAAMLGERDLYDVEFTDSRNGEILYVVARNQIDVGLLAIEGLIPREEA